MSDERHEDIAARLRAEAGARAPERLQADVMLRVRAEPRPRRIRQRRMWRPLGSLAAAACVLAALVFGLSHVNLSGGGQASEGASSASAERAAAPQGVGGGGATAGAGAVGSLRAPNALNRRAVPHQDAATAAAQRALEFKAALELAPGPLRAAVLGRLALSSPLPKGLEALHLHRGRGSH